MAPCFINKVQRSASVALPVVAATDAGLGLTTTHVCLFLYWSDRRYYALSVYGAERKEGCESYQPADNRNGRAILAREARYSAKTLATLAQAMTQEVLARSGSAWDMVKDVADNYGVTIVLEEG